MLGLTLTQLLSSTRRLVQARSRVRGFWPSFAWTGTVLLILVQTWWAIFTFRNELAWNFGEFVLIFAHPTLIYFLAVLVLPDADREGTIDLRANYFAQKSWLSSRPPASSCSACCVPLSSMATFRSTLIDSCSSAFLMMTTAAAVVRSPRLHQVLACAARRRPALHRQPLLQPLLDELTLMSAVRQKPTSSCEGFSITWRFSSTPPASLRSRSGCQKVSRGRAWAVGWSRRSSASARHRSVCARFQPRPSRSR